MGIRVKNWSLLVKPTHDCNLNCQYCYDRPFRERYPGKRMTPDMVNHLLDLAERYAENATWIWHGGEPTLMGVDWYKDMQKLFYRHYHTQFKQDMQTNGMLLDEKWAELSNNYGIEIGVSFDAFNQDMRTGSSLETMEKRLKRYYDAGGKAGTITVINRANYQKQIEIYEYFKTAFKHNVAFNHVYRTDGTLKNQLEISAQEYAKEFKKFYQYWMNDTSPKALSERTAMLMTHHVTGNREMICTYSDCRRCWIGVNPLGEVYPCDRYLPERYKMGNIMDFESIDDLYKADGHRLYSLEITRRMRTHCRECGYFAYCQGGCNANHIAVSGTGAGVDSFSCELFRENFNIVYDLLRTVNPYLHSYNQYLIQYLAQKHIFTLPEVKEFLAEKNIRLDWQYLNHDKELLECEEFKIMRLFNPYTKEKNHHIDLKIPADFDHLDLNANDLKAVKKQRWEILEQIYHENYADLMFLIYQNNG